jgi:uncharacterized repeat protein (TIGR01451 family)
MIAVRALVLVLFFGVWAVGTAYAGLTIQPTTWNVIGLDSNNVNTGPASYPVGVRVCNTGGAAVTNVTGNFVWDSSNTYINLSGASTINVQTLAGGACTDIYFTVAVTRTVAAYDNARRYHITVTGDGQSSVTSPTPREIYVEKIISQNRNSVNSITGPTTVYVGQTYQYTVSASTATGGYAQLQAFLELPNIIFQVLSISTTYTAPSGGTNNKFYADACGWDNNPLSGSYRSCIGPEQYPGGKAGGDVVTTYTVKVVSTGTTTAGTAILDFSGSSYHYNNDYGNTVISITALPPPLTLSKIANPTTASAGSTVTYTLRVTNTGTPSYTLTDFVDTPPTSPATPTYVSGSSTFNGSSIANPVSSGSTRTWTGSFLVPAGQTRDLTYQMVMPNTPGTYSNSAIAHVNEFQIDTTQSTTDNAPATASVTIPPPDMTIAKTHSGNFSQGQVGATYSITATNSGSAPTSAAVSVTDTLPSGLTATAISGTGWTCVLGTLTCTRSDALAAGSSYPVITVTVDVANNAASSVTNSVAVSGGGETNTGNDTATDATTVTQKPDMTISKSHSGNFTQGQTGATYTLTARNSGFAATTGTVTVTDTLPTGLTATGISGTGWTCVLATLTCTRNDALAASTNYPAITVTVNVANNAAASVTNSVSVSGGGENNTSNDTATDPTTVNQLPDMTIVKSHSGNFAQGQTGATYTITATNSGFAATSGTVTVTDTLPSGLTATGISGSGWTCVLGTLTCTRNDALAAGSSYPAITLTVNVANNAAPSVTNSVSVSGGSQTNTSNDSATDPTTVTQLPDLTIAKSHSGNFSQGQTGATYSITVTNSGFAATSGTVTVTDTLPAGLSATGISGTGWTCVLATLTCTRSDALAAGTSYPAITVTVNVANNASASVTNSVAVSGGGETNTGNDTATDPTTVNQFADLTIAKSHSGNFSQGQTGATYSITVTNSGAVATTAAVSVTDTLPSGLTATGISGSGWGCVLGTLTCTRSDALAAGASYPVITLTVNVSNNAASSVTNSVAVSGGGEIITTNDSATDPTTVTQLPDMTITKSHSGNFTQGQTGATYTLTARNSGFASTSGAVTVTDTLPAGLTATAISGTGWTCVLATLTCTRNDALAANTNYPAITVTVNVANNAASSVTNSASVSGGGQTNTSNDSATDPTTVNQLPDLTIAKSHSGNFTQGQTGATYSITATNSGFAATSGTVTVTDTLPSGLTATAISGSGWTCVLATLTCTRSDALVAGANYPVITLTVNVAMNAPASVTNSASISGGGQTNTTNDTANDVTTINAGPPIIGLVKSVNPAGAQIPGTDLTYTIVYTNSGGNPASNFIVIDPNMQNADPLERVFHNLDFKVGSMTSSPGTSGLIASFAYSNDGGTTWTYTPVSGGGGAPAGYDRNVTNVRWTFAGNLSQTSPNNTGSVGFTARIR